MGYLFYQGVQIEDYCRRVVDKELEHDTNRPEWVNPPAWYKGTVKDKMGYAYYKQLECGRRFGLFDKIPRE